jgi:putative phosphoesterase
MKITIIADTHIPDRADKLPEGFLKKSRDTDLFLHAGDLVDLAVLEELRSIAPVTAVWGNMDPLSVRKQLKQKELIKAEGITIGLMHGAGNSINLISLLEEEFQADGVDIIVFGHAHKPIQVNIDNILFFNPGSLTDTFVASYASYGTIEVKGKKYVTKIERI